MAEELLSNIVECSHDSWSDDFSDDSTKNNNTQNKDCDGRGGIAEQFLSNICDTDNDDIDDDDDSDIDNRLPEEPKEEFEYSDEEDDSKPSGQGVPFIDSDVELYRDKNAPMNDKDAALGNLVKDDIK